mgnify:CR=1 FL=1
MLDLCCVNAIIFFLPLIKNTKCMEIFFPKSCMLSELRCKMSLVRGSPFVVVSLLSLGFFTCLNVHIFTCKMVFLVMEGVGELNMPSDNKEHIFCVFQMNL